MFLLFLFKNNAMLIFNVDSQSSIPIYKQIFDHISQLIEQEVLIEGDKLPSSRKLASQLDVNRSTVCKAYDELWAFGYIDSQQGKFSTIRKRAAIIKNNLLPDNDHFEWEQRINDEVDTVNLKYLPNFDNTDSYDIINFSRLYLDNNILPVEKFRKNINRVIQKYGAELLTYNSTRGFPLLIDFICKRLQLSGINTHSDNILVCNGTHNGLDLMLRCVLKPGDKIILEAPSYSASIPLFQLHGANIIPVKMNDDGLDLEHLKATLKENVVEFIFTMPNFQNPTGVTTSQQHREKLYDICRQNNVPIVEDGFEEELKYFGKSVLPIKSIDSNSQVVYIGSFSKTLFPGLRVGWLVADKYLIEQLNKIKQTTELSGNMLVQAAVYDFCQSGEYELHVKRLHRLFRKRMTAALSACEKYLPKNICSFSKPKGGYCFWLQIKNNNYSEEELWELFVKNGVKLTPGNLFYTKGNKEISFRISISQVSEDEIKLGIKRIAETLQQIN